MRDLKDIFNEYDTSEGVPFKLLSKRVHFPEDNESLYDYVYISENTPWTVLSYKIYGDIRYWWVLSQLNKKYPFYAKKTTNVKFIPKNTLIEMLKYI